MKTVYQHTLTTIISISSVLGILWVFAEPKVNQIVDDRVETYIESDKYNDSFHKRKFLEFVNSPAYEKVLADYLSKNTSETSSVSFRKLLAIELNIEPEQVAKIIRDVIKNSELYNKRTINLLKAVNDEHPEYNVWQID